MVPIPPANLVPLFRTDLRARAAYAEGAGIYRIVPRAVCLPNTESDLLALIRWASSARVPIIPRGAGSSVTGSNVGDAVILDLTRTTPRRLEVLRSTASAHTSASVRWGALTDTAREVGLRLPPDPSSGAFATLGGMASTNASGARTVRYGSIRHWVQGLTFVTADGDRVITRRGESAADTIPAIARFERDAAPAIRNAGASVARAFPQTRKNSAGYAIDHWLRSGDLVDLLVGSEGTLGVITEIEWKLAPVPLARTGLRVALADLALLSKAVEALLPLEPSALELLDRTFIDLVRTNRGEAVAPVGTEGILLVEFEGDNTSTLRDITDHAVRRLVGIALDVDTALTPEDETTIWSLRHAASPIIADLPSGRRSLQVIEDACVPVKRMAEYIAFVRRAAETLRLPVVIFGHAGDGNIHVNVLPEVDHRGWEESLFSLFQQVTDEVLRLGGTPTGEHGDGRLRSGVLEQLYGTEVFALFRLVKQAFDPQGILNPGVKVPDPQDGRPGGSAVEASPLKHLKAGAGAAAIPLDIAEALREIERRGDYRRDRLGIADQAVSGKR